MTLSVRLDTQLEKQLTRLSKRLHLSKSEIVKRSLSEYLKSHTVEETPYSLGADLFGAVGSGRPDLSERRKEYIKAKIRAKNTR